MSNDLPAAVQAPAAAPSRPSLRVLAAFVMPLYFVLMMSATLVTALHHPQPHDLALTIAGPDASTSRLAAGIERQGAGAFDVTTTIDPASARAAVLRRDTVGAIALGGTASAPTVTTYVASAGGRSAASAVEAVGSGVASQLRVTPRIVDVAPLASTDTLGTGVFYLVVYSSIGGYLTLIVLMQVLPGARLRTRYGVAGLAAVVTPLLVFGLASIFLGGFGASFGQIMALLGIDALYVFTIGLVVVAAEQLVNRAAIFLVAPIAIFINIASAGGGSPESMLPGFWQAMHSIWFGAGANEAMRDVIYFPAADPIRWIVQLLVWTISLLVVTLIIEGVKLIWRLQSVVITQRRQVESVREHLHLLSVPKQPVKQSALTERSSDQTEERPLAEPRFAEDRDAAAAAHV